MGCASCNSSNNTPNLNIPQRAIRPQGDCMFSAGIISIWYSKLKCVKDNSQLSKINLTVYEVNSYLGYLQSAMNNPDNYCLFAEQLTDYQTNILPRIISNVSTCI